MGASSSRNGPTIATSQRGLGITALEPRRAPILASAVAVSLATTRNAFGGNGNNGNGNGNGGNGNGANCFQKGTKILTADGERKIEDLAIGDLLPTMFGGLRPVQ